MQITKDYTEEEFKNHFGKLVIIRGTELNTSKNRPNKYKKYEVRCRCPLNTTFDILTSQLNRGTSSCGKCVRIEDNLTDKLVKDDIHGRLKVVGFNWEHQAWEFICQCIKSPTIFLPAKDVLSGNTKSCGCLNTETRKTHAMKLINKKTDPDVKNILAKKVYRSNYKDGNIEYDLFRKLISQPCYYCDVVSSCAIIKMPSKYSYLAELPEEDRTLRYNGIDRLVSYVIVNGEKIKTKHNIGNIATACNIDNTGKRDWFPERYIHHLIKIANHKQNLTPEQHREQHKNVDIACLTEPMKASFNKTVRSRFGSSTAKRKFYADGDLTLSIYYQLSQLSCYYCGEAAINGKTTNRAKNIDKSSQHFKDTGDFTSNGLDRLHSYEILDGIKTPTKHNFNNLVACCADCNHIKNDHDFDDWTKWLARIKSKWSNVEFATKELTKIIEHTAAFTNVFAQQTK